MATAVSVGVCLALTFFAGRELLRLLSRVFDSMPV